MTQTITASSATDFAAQLAELLIETESVQSDSARQQRDAARADFLHEAENEVKALHEAANDMSTGAWASAAMTVVSSGCMIASSVAGFDDCNKSLADKLKIVGGTFNELTAPMKTLVGEAPAAHANANAKRFETLAEKAKWVSGDASEEIEKAAKLGDKILDVLQGINQDQNSANTALIGRI